MGSPNQPHLKFGTIVLLGQKGTGLGKLLSAGVCLRRQDE